METDISDIDARFKTFTVYFKGAVDLLLGVTRVKNV